MSVESLKPRIEPIQERIALVKGRGEEATKQALVLPMLDALGFDIWNPAEVCPEFDADFSTRRGAQKERVDLAVVLDGEPRIFIEVKSVDTSLDGHRGQLSRYFNAVSTVSLAILTNGAEYRFYTDTGEPNIMDERPFHVANLESVDLGVDVLARFHKTAFSPEAIRGYASDLIYTSRLVAFLRSELDLRKREPSEELVRWVLGTTDLYDGRIVSSVVDRFRPLVKNALQTVVRDIIRRSMFAIDSGIEGESYEGNPTSDEPAGEDASPPVEATEDTSEDAEEDNSTSRNAKRMVVTTDEELRAFDIVREQFDRSSLASATVYDPSNRKDVAVELSYKDTTGYFGIYLNKSSWWCLRLNLDGRTKWAGLPYPQDELPDLPGGLTFIKGNSYAPARVKLTSEEDLLVLAPVIHAVFERVIADHQPS